MKTLQVVFITLNYVLLQKRKPTPFLLNVPSASFPCASQLGSGLSAGAAISRTPCFTARALQGGTPHTSHGHRGPAPPLLGAGRQRGAAGAALAAGAGARGLGALSPGRLHPLGSAAPAGPRGRHDSRAPPRDARRALPLAGAPRAMETAGSARARP